MSKDTKNLVLEVFLGIALYTLAAVLAALVIYPKGPVLAGLVLGMVLALAMFFSMAVVLEGAMESGDAKTVQKRTVIGSVVRYLVLIAVLIAVITWFPDRINAVALVIGVLGLKAGAYLQPVLHKVLSRGKEDTRSQG